MTSQCFEFLKCACNNDNCVGMNLVKSEFWKSALSIWLANSCNDTNTNCTHIWNNMNVTLQGKPLFFKKWVDKGFLYVKDF